MALTETALSDKERKRFRIGIWIGVTLVSLMLMGLSVTGAWIASNGNYWYTGAIAGVEIVAYFALTGIVFASNNLRRVVGWAIFIACVTVCVFNAERAIKQAFDLEGSVAVLKEEAKTLREQADRQDIASEGAQERQIAEQQRLRDENAALELELELMTSNTRIEEAQRRLCVLQLYPCDLIDGVRAEVTLQAMAQRGEAITRTLALNRQKLDDPGDLSVSDKSSVLRVQATEKEDQANTIMGSVYWIFPTLIALELIRSFAVWAFLLDSTIIVTKKKVREMEADAEEDALEAELKVAETEVEIDEVRSDNEDAEEVPEPEDQASEGSDSEASAEEAPEDAAEVEPEFDIHEELDPKTQRARDGGLASGFAKNNTDRIAIPVDADFAELGIEIKEAA